MSEEFTSVVADPIPSEHFLNGKSLGQVTSLVHYDANEGRFYKVVGGRTSNVAMKVNLDRRVRLKVPFEQSKKVSVTTLAVFCMTGQYVDGRKIQFKDGDRSNLKWDNLTLVRKDKPRQRKRIPKPPPIGPQTFKFSGTITIDGENITLTGKKGKEIIL